ncbi:uncharacterized protein LOC122303743 isoform X3 [Carya illinoinensis]|uniref:Uncharacterized protein n=1 Tax=Carya illinoinensis TaxID=32201 RepID=A0A8T1R4W2_CARIL|nr:uncharacterized protein LOC122303743 isoform X3 [Carya illinoinensis]KAG6661151.1 hypothetical protein CIPAW_03G154000 [Carya illinoinensis]
MDRKTNKKYAYIAVFILGVSRYSLRHLHERRVDQRLETIEKAMSSNYDLGHSEIRKITASGHVSAPACVATAGTALIIGDGTNALSTRRKQLLMGGIPEVQWMRYGLGWRGGKWHANRQFRKEQMKLLGQIKPRGWQLFGRIKPKGWQFQSLRRRITRSREPETAAKTPEKMLKDASTHIILE